MEWFNPPPRWAEDGGVLEVEVAGGTDLWRQTHYGFVRDTGHIGGRTVEGDVEVSVRVSADYRDQYDQAGLALRIDERTWIKAGIEHVDGVQQVSAVVTREFSDWSVSPLADPPAELAVRLRRRGEAIEVHWSLDDGASWTLLRLAYLPPGVPALVGVMAAAPDGTGFVARFRDLRITP